jgi:hypothetical protein
MRLSAAVLQRRLERRLLRQGSAGGLPRLQRPRRLQCHRSARIGLGIEHRDDEHPSVGRRRRVREDEHAWRQPARQVLRKRAPHQLSQWRAPPVAFVDRKPVRQNLRDDFRPVERLDGWHSS